MKESEDIVQMEQERPRICASSLSLYLPIRVDTHCEG